MILRFKIFTIIFLIFRLGLSFSGNYVNPPDTIISYYDDKHLRYDDYIYRENIKTVMVYREGWELSYPVIKLKSDDKIKLSFDDLDNDLKTYTYTLIHCNSKWQPSDLMPFDYINGFTEYQISDYKHSFNTFIKYVHYNLIIPNDEVKPKISGNYIIKVYENYDPDKLVLTARFCVEENSVLISARIMQPKIIEYRKSHQEVDFTIINNTKSIADPYNDIKVVIYQNSRKDNAITGLKPLFVKDNELVYDYDLENLFPGGNEFLHIDLKSMRFMSDRIKNIDFKAPNYYVELFQDEPKPFKNYFYDIDINGKYIVKVQEGNDSETEADYIYVDFTLPYDAPEVNGNIYVLGEFTDWNFNKDNKMVYDYEKKCYRARMLLKQGFYNYEYVVLRDDSKTGDAAPIEGNHFETENDYLIFVYYRDITSRYDKLAGVKIINSSINK